MPSRATTAGRSLAPRIAFVAKFGAVMIVLYVIVALNPVNDRVIVPFTEIVASASAGLLRVIDGGINSVGTVIQSQRFAIDVHNGCNGIEAVILVCAAILAFPATLRSRLTGVLIASLLIQILNVVRLSSLFWLGTYYPRVFDLFHVAVWQSLPTRLSDAKEWPVWIFCWKARPAACT